MLLIFEKGTMDGMYHEMRRYAKTNNKYMKNHDKNKEPSYLVYLDASNLYRWVISHLSANSVKWKKTFINLMKTS